jgi:diadenylate cyclase
MEGVEDERRRVLQDYFHEDSAWHLEESLAGLGQIDTDNLLDLKTVAETLHLPDGVEDLDGALQPKGYRLLAKIPRLPETIIEHIVERFGDLSKIMRATIRDLDEVEGVGETRAKAIKEGLSRLAETSILDRYS